MKFKCVFLLLSLVTAACASAPQSPEAYLQKKGLNAPTPETFQHCHAYGCKMISDIELSKKEWRDIERAFSPRAKTAEKERAQIAKAIGLFETYAGAHAGTFEDHYGTFMKVGAYQQDCVDESTNTTIYLSLLQDKGLMRLHDTSGPQVRLPIIHAGRWPHQSATITETASGEAFAVDSWFHDNGYPAEIMPLTDWKKGWKPEEHFTHAVQEPENADKE